MHTFTAVQYDTHILFLRLFYIMRKKLFKFLSLITLVGFILHISNNNAFAGGSWSVSKEENIDIENADPVRHSMAPQEINWENAKNGPNQWLSICFLIHIQDEYRSKRLQKLLPILWTIAEDTSDAQCFDAMSLMWKNYNHTHDELLPILLDFLEGRKAVPRPQGVSDEENIIRENGIKKYIFDFIWGTSPVSLSARTALLPFMRDRASNSENPATQRYFSDKLQEYDRYYDRYLASRNGQ